MEELVIKVPAPFSGIEDLGFTARYPLQEWDTQLHDVPFIVEGPERPMHRLMDRLTLFADKDRLVDTEADDEAYGWTSPIQLSDEVCILAFRDRSFLRHATDADVERSYVWNLVRPLAVTFLRDCIRIGELRLSEHIVLVLDTGHAPTIDFEIERTSISPENGTRLLFAA